MLVEIDKEAPPREKLDRLASEMRSLPQVELETFHHFADGMYCRVLPRVAGTVIVGRVHRKEHFYIVTKGKVSVYSGDSQTVYEAGSVIVSKPGTQRAVLALEDSICMTVHRTDNTDLERIEEELIEPDSVGLFDAYNKLLGAK